MDQKQMQPINTITIKYKRPILLVFFGLVTGIIFGIYMDFHHTNDIGSHYLRKPLQVIVKSQQGNMNTSEYLAKTLASRFSEVEYSVAVEPAANLGNPTCRGVLSSTDEGNKIFASSHFVGMDFFKIFPYDFVQSTVFLGPNSIYLSEEVALRIFNRTGGIIGKRVNWENEMNGGEYIVSGIFYPTSLSGSDQFEVLFSIANEQKKGKAKVVGQELSAYVMLREGVDSRKFDSKVKDFINKGGKGIESNLFTTSCLENE